MFFISHRMKKCNLKERLEIKECRVKIMKSIHFSNNLSVESRISNTETVDSSYLHSPLFTLQSNCKITIFKCDALVGEDIILPPRKSTACCDEWYNMPDILRNPGLRCPQLPITPAPGSARTEKSPPSPHCRHTICAGPASESQGIHRAAAPVCCRPGHPAAPPVFPLSGPVQ